MTETGEKILIAYDGSANADHAIAVAGRLLGGGPAQLIHAWEPAFRAAARAAIYLTSYLETEEALEEERTRANAVAERGAALAREAGFEVEAKAVDGEGPLWHTIVEEADAIDARLIVMGTRGLTGVRSTIGSVSHHVASHSSAPVLTVPLEQAPR